MADLDGKDFASTSRPLPAGGLRHLSVDGTLGEESGTAPAAFVMMAAAAVVLSGGFLTALLARA